MKANRVLSGTKRNSGLSNIQVEPTQKIKVFLLLFLQKKKILPSLNKEVAGRVNPGFTRATIKKEDSSFFEKKEAKKLLFFIA
jgi:hypothetical protein